jgi:hypothetical protein
MERRAAGTSQIAPKETQSHIRVAVDVTWHAMSETDEQGVAVGCGIDKIPCSGKPDPVMDTATGLRICILLGRTEMCCIQVSAAGLTQSA